MAEINKELQFIILQYFKNEEKNELLFRVGMELGIYFDESYIKKLVIEDRLFELDTLLSKFIHEDIESELLGLVYLKKYIMYRAFCDGCLRITKQIYSWLFNKGQKSEQIKKNIESICIHIHLDKFDKSPIISEYMKDLDKIRTEQLANDIITSLLKSERIQKLREFPKISDENLLKKLISKGIRFEHIKNCKGTPRDDITIVSLLNMTHECQPNNCQNRKSILRDSIIIPKNIFNLKTEIEIISSDNITNIKIFDNIVVFVIGTKIIYGVNLQNGQSVFKLELPQIISFTLNNTLLAISTSTQVSIYLLGQNLQTVKTIERQNISSIVFNNTDIIISDSKQCFVYNYFNEQPTFVYLDCTEVIPMKLSNTFGVIKGNEFCLFNKKLESGYEMIFHYQFNEPIKAIIDNTIIVTLSNKYALIPQTQHFNINIHNNSYPIVSANKENIFVLKDETLYCINSITNKEVAHISIPKETIIATNDNVVITKAKTIESITMYNIKPSYSMINLIDPVSSINNKYNTLTEMTLVTEQKKLSVQQKNTISTNTPIYPIKRRTDSLPIPVSEKKRVEEISKEPIATSFDDLINEKVSTKWVLKEQQKLITIKAVIKKFHFISHEQLMICETKEKSFFLFKLNEKSYERLISKTNQEPDIAISKEINQYGPFGEMTRNGAYFIYWDGTCCTLVRSHFQKSVTTFCECLSSHPTLSSLGIFPMDSNSILVGFDDGNIAIYKANKKFCFIQLPNPVHDTVSYFIFYNQEDKKEITTKFIVLYENGIVEELLYDRKNNQLSKTNWCVDLKPQKLVYGFVDSQNQKLYVVGKYSLNQVDLSTKVVKKVSFTEVISSVALSHNNRNLIVVIKSSLYNVSLENISEYLPIEKSSEINDIEWIEPYGQDSFAISCNGGDIRSCCFEEISSN
ncbi:hypothetical protein EHI8A_037030 [Entamoeba histolytica HM-1:IMSS-B]|uniref:Uncharacterized protein n=6 Tax=Entamoeba histolytica TaxID=5759 RepID=C4LY61_ENTH1|nr:hypothetical protein EHI_051420 [Entamoeba histolytica HM-1:IMSS]EMD43347.1 Hypothetical protein EHI5A_053540 [Entamoeba histolytica KU27]EMH75640.1 hypothetical protein EHI8A_037030 [Entamoeba histolytica HM-1:IMSS-B]ENY60706.1 hypothetical protein EHI7A_038510 [Entamoeba histolytica HM-1:IMSS-A]GAT93728.1 hypothetical protein CL6EHI_051420 [Entamoeba histolytica]EAL45903.2 hypothetical protein EHI_051420 [Entamoeba histolytica HM-1:IMSS]|eukprot:XP_651289.2 hypothetical protein EHI_051420 [Entamoeba histolytica HM-1:IMSS]